MKILVTGVGGQLGYDVCRRLTQLGIEHKGVDVQDFDLTNADAVMDAVRAYAPDAIIHCAAYTNVEKAESMPEVCADVNGMGTLNMVRAALAVQAKLMYISTDYVFEGTGDQAYSRQGCALGKSSNTSASPSIYQPTARPQQWAAQPVSGLAHNWARDSSQAW